MTWQLNFLTDIEAITFSCECRIVCFYPILAASSLFISRSYGKCNYASADTIHKANIPSITVNAFKSRLHQVSQWPFKTISYIQRMESKTGNKVGTKLEFSAKLYDEGKSVICQLSKQVKSI